jgi:hypothetical protein
MNGIYYLLLENITIEHILTSFAFLVLNYEYLNQKNKDIKEIAVCKRINKHTPNDNTRLHK